MWDAQSLNQSKVTERTQSANRHAIGRPSACDDMGIKINCPTHIHKQKDVRVRFLLFKFS